MVYVVCEGCTLTYIKYKLHCHIGPPAIDNTHQSWKEPTTVCCDDSTPTPLFQVTTCHYHWTYFPNCLDMNDNSTCQWLHLCYFLVIWRLQGKWFQCKRWHQQQGSFGGVVVFRTTSSQPTKVLQSSWWFFCAVLSRRSWLAGSGVASRVSN